VETVNIHEAKTHLSRLVERAASGEEIIIARSGRPVARLVPFARTGKPRTFGRMRGQIQIADDFDDALPEDVLAGFHGDALAPDQ
jgi:prevent-host-death family protein